MKVIFSCCIVLTVLLGTCLSASIAKPNERLTPYNVLVKQSNIVNKLNSNLFKSKTVKAVSIGNYHSLAIKGNDKIAHISKYQITSPLVNKKPDFETSDDSSPETSPNEPENTLNNIINAFYGLTAGIDIGTPGQRQHVYLNFFTADFWILGNEYNLAERVTDVFNESESQTYIATDQSFRLSGDDFNARGVKSSDIVALGGYKREQKINVANSTSKAFSDLGIHGILGLVKDTKGNSALRDIMQHTEDHAVTFYYNPRTKVIMEDDDLCVIFGGSDPKICNSDWKSVKANSAPVWTVNVFGVSANGSQQSSNESLKGGIFNSFWLTYVPEDTLTQIVKLVGAVELENSTDIYSITCDINELPTLNFILDDQEIPLTPENYIIKIENVCYLKIFKAYKEIKQTYGLDYVFGEPLFRSNCIKFDTQEETVHFSTPIIRFP